MLKNQTVDIRTITNNDYQHNECTVKFYAQ